MKFYVASNLPNRNMASLMVRALEGAGHECAYDWTEHGSMQTEPDKWPDVAEAELAGVMRADFVVVLLPGGRGTHVELGAALAMGTRVFLVGDDELLRAGSYNCVFHFHPAVTRVEAPADVFELLTSES